MRGRYRAYPAEFRQQILELVAAGRTPAELAEEYGVAASSIRLWLRRARATAAQADGGVGLTAAEKQELRRLRQENAVLRQEKEIRKKAAAWFARESSGLPGESTSS